MSLSRRRFLAASAAVPLFGISCVLLVLLSLYPSLSLVLIK